MNKDDKIKIMTPEDVINRFINEEGVEYNQEKDDWIIEAMVEYSNNIMKKIKKEQLMKWRRYRFQTKSVKDYRPIFFDPHYPWWCSGYSAEQDAAVIVAYLPEGEELSKYWDDAFDVSFTEETEITFSERFPKPEYFLASILL